MTFSDFLPARFRTVTGDAVAPAVEPPPAVAAPQVPFSFAAAESFLLAQGFQTGRTRGDSLVLHGLRMDGGDEVRDWHSCGRQELQELFRGYLESIDRTDIWSTALVEDFKSFLLAGARQRPSVIR